jgi:hypothetical protein
MWRANTCSLLLDALNGKRKDVSDDRRTLADEHAQKIFQVFASWSTEPESMASRLSDIILESINLDDQLCQQVAWLRWESLKQPQSDHVFDTETMELERGETRSSADGKVELVLAPALIKKGNSSGEGFDTATTLLKMEVTCEAPPRVVPKGDPGASWSIIEPVVQMMSRLKLR